MVNLYDSTTVKDYNFYGTWLSDYNRYIDMFSDSDIYELGKIYLAQHASSSALKKVLELYIRSDQDHYLFW